jgi:hypothetical protein
VVRNEKVTPVVLHEKLQYSILYLACTRTVTFYKDDASFFPTNFKGKIFGVKNKRFHSFDRLNKIRLDQRILRHHQQKGKMSCLSSACPVVPDTFCLSPFCIFRSACLFYLYCSACHVLPVLFCLSCSTCTVLRVLYCLFFLHVPFGLCCSACNMCFCLSSVCSACHVPLV